MYIPFVTNRLKDEQNTSDIFSAMTEERSIFLTGPIDDTTASTVVATLLFLDYQDDKKPIYLYINSPGGMVSAGLSIIATMQHISSKCITIAMGQAYSMAATILASGDERYILPYTRIMIHQPSGGMQGKHTDMVITIKEMEETRKSITDILAYNTGHTEDEINRDIEKDKYMSAEEAVNYGLADEVFLPNPEKMKF